MTLITNLAKNAAKAAKKLAILDTEQKNAILIEMASALRANEQGILEANALDLGAARDNQLSQAMVDRLTLNSQRINDMAVGLEEVAALPDPVGETRTLGKQPSGIEVQKMRVPLGVICMIYEARPNVTADAGALCFKSGNGVILRGGKEALNSSLAIAHVMHSVLDTHGLPTELITVVPDPDRALMLELMQQKDYIDLIIPRGGEGLIEFVTKHSTVPVIQHFKGVCHLYVDKDADLDMAIELLLNGKTQRTGVCNALEGLIVHSAIAQTFLPRVREVLSEAGVQVHACQSAAAYFSCANVLDDSEFGEEYLGLEIAIRIVDDFSGALVHIDQFGSHHTEVICTKSEQAAKQFQTCVDASVVMVNASSRFSDGGQLGLGAEIGIATTKLHAYGPMGLESLTTEKYLVNGTGNIRS
ncbi:MULTISPECIES: glutamate-5-semialdehyde dehydrogenase [Pseudoalteromonas]|uniref:Gamma-glutamyl phosphate reductase n=1 Tax=Pseudoalteromonas luteoviolacea (strain 2ta16) TaxID=1353533 RepID=V4JCT4_PSEL2|nr:MULTISPECIES: glutamate-5-semialdehyde dehydrogenase [Pseudoalteromonas]ESP92882.1 gamma-glutamyl phosphate reductase [Pseudoalteromonas luteoviolacea 2ta16]KZN35694.1 gamma-glutamyl phosphate reductase [Pseudoalteromonas luteoviolacea NCIMB 1944]MCG7546354.1 glutamate-5-semialdehyde dehydrogenase [Pseudoalteromonas sp. Of7M-16]